VDSVPDPLLRNSGSTGNRTRISATGNSDHRGGPEIYTIEIVYKTDKDIRHILELLLLGLSGQST
jgi:hypothetical protein